MLAWLVACKTPAPTPGVPRSGSDATLAELAFEDLDLDPAFDPAHETYLLRWNDAGEDVDIVAESTDPEASVTVHQTTLAGEPVDDALDVAQKVLVDVVSADATASRTYTVVVVPQDFPEITTTQTGPTSPGLVFLATLSPDLPGSTLLVLDAQGFPAWYSSVPSPSYDFRRSPDGGASVVAVGEPNEGVLLDAAFAEIGRWTAPPLLDGREPELDVHELFVLPDGGLVTVGLYADPRDLSRWGGPVDGRIVHTAVQEVAPDGQVRFRWTTDGAVDLDAVPLWVYEPAADAWDYAHLNSVAVDPDDGNWVVSLRLPSQVLKVARGPTTLGDRTFQSGQVMWRLGGRDGDLRIDGDQRPNGVVGFWGQHSARMLPGGRLVLFDNAIQREALGASFLDQQIALVPTGGTRVVEYALDLTRRTATRVWEHAFPDPAFTQAGGSVQRLPDGHTLIGWGDLPMTLGGGPSVTEVDANGDVVWELTLPPELWSYRAWRAE